MSELTFKSAEEILDFQDLQVVTEYVPEWKTSIRFRVMSAEEAIRFQDSLSSAQLKRTAWIRLFALCAVKEDGTRMFTDQMLEKLRQKSMNVFMRVQKRLLVLNGFAQPDKSLEAVSKILTEAGVDAAVITRVAELWKEDDEAADAVKNG